MTPEVRTEDGWTTVTLPAADISQAAFRHVVRRRYMFVWADDGDHHQHRFVTFPRPVEPKTAVVRFLNGVVDARVKVA